MTRPNYYSPNPDKKTISLLDAFRDFATYITPDLTPEKQVKIFIRRYRLEAGRYDDPLLKYAHHLKEERRKWENINQTISELKTSREDSKSNSSDTQTPKD